MKKQILLFLLLIVAFSFISNAQNSAIKRVFIYNFIKNIQWPISYQQGDFEIGIVGNSPIIRELENMAKTYKAGNQKIIVYKFNNVSEISRCHIIYISENKSDKIDDILKTVNGNHTLIISEKEGLAKKGAAINFVSRNNEQQFELNKTVLKKQGLIVNSNLVALSIPVD